MNEKKFSLDLTRDIYQFIQWDKTISNDNILCVIGKEEFFHFYETLPKSCVVISIADPYTNNLDRSVPNCLLSTFNDYIKFYFHDLEKPFADLKTFSREEAIILSNFIKKNKDKQFIIHCEAGMSRSGAIAKSILLWLHNCTNINEITIIDTHFRYYPNKLVLKLLLEELFNIEITDNYIDYKDSLSTDNDLIF